MEEPGTVRQRILIADDNVDAADSLAALLACMGHEVRAAYSGVSAVETAEHFRPDVVLLDLGMPGLNGYETAHYIREAEWGRDAIVVAVTGWGSEADHRQSLQAGFDFHLTKPVDPDVIRRLVAAAA
ncbi:MAG: response regulator [Gemmatimonadales bacterium]